MSKSTMTIDEFIRKWLNRFPEDRNSYEETWARITCDKRNRLQKAQMMRDLKKVITLHRNPLLGGITNAIFELEQGEAAVPVGEGEDSRPWKRSQTG